MAQRSNLDDFLRDARLILEEYGRDYAIGALRGLAVRNMLEVSLPDPTEGFYPIVKIHSMALKDLEDLFYAYLQDNGSVDREDLIGRMIEERIWE